MSLEISNSIERDDIAWYKGRLLSWKLFEGHVSWVRRNILKSKDNATEASYSSKVLNLCEDHYHFIVVFTASMLEGRTTVMPSNRSQGELTRMIEANKGIQSIYDAEIVDICLLDMLPSYESIEWQVSLIPDAMIVAELYTSGSTGIPLVHLKSWGQLVNSAQQVHTRFGLNNFIHSSVVATVPPQHMFGFEMCIVMPLVCGVTIHHSQPFYPLDIQRALSDMQSPRILVTTPIHLKACNTLKDDWPEVEFVMSATAPMPEDVACKGEEVMNTEVREVYGCSEVGAIATRRVTKNINWKLLPDYILDIVNTDALLHIPTSVKPVILPDVIEALPDKTFRLVGRNSDLIKIAGKRGSIAEVSARIRGIQGVKDAIAFMPVFEKSKNNRLAALVVAPGMTTEQIREVLVNEVDRAFLPRPMCLVKKLPYNSIGKLLHADLVSSLEKYLKEIKAC